MRTDQQRYLLTVVGKDIRRRRRLVEKKRATERPWRDTAKRLAYAEDVYRTLGGDPSTLP